MCENARRISVYINDSRAFFSSIMHGGVWPPGMKRSFPETEKTSILKRVGVFFLPEFANGYRFLPMKKVRGTI